MPSWSSHACENMHVRTFAQLVHFKYPPSGETDLMSEPGREKRDIFPFYTKREGLWGLA